MKSKYIDNSDPGYLPHNRAEIQGTSQFLFAEGATTLEEARAMGFLDLGCFLGFEIKSESKATDVKKANRGKTFTSSKLGSDVTIGVDLTTKEIADMRKARIILLGKDVEALTQAALAADTAVTLPVFTAENPAKINHAYQLLKDGNAVREITALTLTVGVDELEENVDYVLDVKLGMVRFIKDESLPAVEVTAKATATAIAEGDENYMLGIQAMEVPRRRGYGHILVWDGDPGSNLVMEFEPRPVEVIPSGGFKVDADNQSEATISVSFTSNRERVLVRS